MSYTDRTLTCADCGAEFTFTAGEQEFHASKGFSNDPRRCPACRSARRASRNEGGGGGGGGSYSGGGGGGGSFGGERREMFDVVCAECGKDTRVPFRPSGNRPVYCSECFSQQSDRRGSGSSYSGGGGGGGRGRR
ncbi:MAG TPA: zinc-ribbon domain containing protein [Candidatus Xenobia bacterium]